MMSEFKAADPYEPLRVIMSRYGAQGEPRSFYWAVNEAYHTAEAKVYDQQHQDMFDSLGPIWQRLQGHLPPGPHKLKVLDVGAGTGLVMHFFNRFMPERVKLLCLLDPNQAMLDKCAVKTRNMGFACELIRGDLASLKGEALFEVITVNSVLHHVVELDAFFAQVKRLLRPKGILLTAQDPRAEAMTDPVFRQRHEQNKPPVRPDTALKRMRRSMSRVVRRAINKPYPQSPLARDTNGPLLDKGVIKSPMDIESINAVTDFHVFDQPGEFGKGIARYDQQLWLEGFAELDYFTYDYFGLGWRNLNQDQRDQELQLQQAGDYHGMQFGSAWRRD